MNFSLEEFFKIWNTHKVRSSIVNSHKSATHIFRTRRGGENLHHIHKNMIYRLFQQQQRV